VSVGQRERLPRAAPALPCGREREAGALRSAIQRAAAGERQRVLLSGEAGSGKSHLLRQVLAASGLQTAWGDTSEFGNGEFGPVKDLLRRLAREHPRDLARLRARHPLLWRLLPGTADGAPDPPPSRDALFDGLAQGLLSLADSAPYAIVFDDLHLADHATVELLARIADRLGGEPLLLVLAHRSDDLPRAHPLRRLRQQWRRGGGINEIELSPLDPDAVLQVAAHYLGGAAGPVLAADLQRLCSGLPLYIEELARALVARGALRQTAAGLERTADSPWPMPESLRDSVLLRLAELPPSAQRLAERAAVMGPRLNLVALAGMAADPDDLERLAEAGWIVDTEPGQAVFRHALLREVIYGQIPWTRRRQWHADCATRLEAIGGPAELLAEHWLAAREPELARAALLQVADRARRLHAYADAAAQAVRALELWPEGQDEPGRLQTLDRLAECAQFAGQPDGAARAWLELCERAERARLAPWLGPTQRRLALLHAMNGDFERSLGERERAADAFAAAQRPLEAAQELYAAATIASFRNQLQRALALLDRLQAVAETRADLALQALAGSLRGRALARSGRIAEGLQVARDALELAQAHGLAAVLGMAYQRVADCHEQAGDYAQSRNIFLAGVDWCAANGQNDGLEMCKACALPVLEQCGEWALALRLAEEIAADGAAPGWTHAIAHGQIGRLQAMRGDHEAARLMLRRAIDEARAVGVATVEWSLRSMLALNEWWLGRPRAARDEAQAALRDWSAGEEHHHVLPAAALLGDLHTWAGDLDGLHACLQAAATAARANSQPEALAGLALAQGDIHLATGHAADALREWTAAAQWLADMPLPLARARVHRRLAEAHARLGDDAAAVRRLRDAIDGYKALGAVPYLREATDRLRALAPEGLTTADQRQLQAGLTPRQLQILARVAHGRTDKQIARELDLSPRTVEMHVARLLATLQCHSRAEAVRRGGELGLIGG
jgi:DNA-binding CsgD family transcriptional regulator/tetratricopeptide (TPR) repeat protein